MHLPVLQLIWLMRIRRISSALGGKIPTVIFFFRRTTSDLRRTVLFPESKPQNSSNWSLNPIQLEKQVW